MAELSLVADTEVEKFPLGNRFVVVAQVASVTNGGSDYVTGDTLGLQTVDAVVGVTNPDATVAIRAKKNTQDFSATTHGSVALAAASGTDDVTLVVIGR